MPRVGRTAFLLGFAGLLPQALAVLLVSTGAEYRIGEALAFAYGGLILSFLGGMWWGFAMRREHGQERLATLAVLPALVALAIAVAGFVRGTLDQALVALGLAIMLTLVVDRHLARAGEAPADWLRLRVPLSLGLGALTILAGAL